MEYARASALSKLQICFLIYEGYSKISPRLVGKKKRVVIAPKRTLIIKK